MQHFYEDMDVKSKDREDEDKDYLERRERRRERRMEKKQHREQLVNKIKIVSGIGAVCVVIACICIGSGSAMKDKEDKENQIAGQSEQVQTAEEENTQEMAVNDAENGQAELENVGVVGTTQIVQFTEAVNVKEITSETIESGYVILIDADSNTIIAKKNAYERIVPASMTKVLTLLVAAESIEQDDLDDTFTMTQDISDYAYINDCSSVGFLSGEVITVSDLIYGTVLASGGDAAVGLATYVAGSHEAFVEKMNQKLEQLGISDTSHFTNCVGIYDEELYCTVYDMAIIMKAAMQNELCREVLNARTYTTSRTTEHPEGILISNWFMRRIEDKDTGGEVMGAKTGYVEQSGSCAVSYQKNANGITYICVTADAASSWRCIYDHVEIYNDMVK